MVIEWKTWDLTLQSSCYSYRGKALYVCHRLCLCVTCGRWRDGCAPLDRGWKKQVSGPSNWFSPLVLLDSWLRATSNSRVIPVSSDLHEHQNVCVNVEVCMCEHSYSEGVNLACSLSHEFSNHWDVINYEKLEKACVKSHVTAWGGMGEARERDTNVHLLQAPQWGGIPGRE